MASARVHIVSFYASVDDRLRDWRRLEGPSVLLLPDKYMPAGGFIVRARLGAMKCRIIFFDRKGP